MIDDQVILTIERLRDDLAELRFALRKKYPSAVRQVTAEGLKMTAAHLAEKWMVDLAQRREVVEAIDSDYRGDLNVHFQRLLTFSERASKRSRYESEIKEILSRFTVDLVIPLKRLRSQGRPERVGLRTETSMQQTRDNDQGTGLDDFRPTAFVGHSFAPADGAVVDCIMQSLEAIGITVVTGKKPNADRISDKVKKLIDGQYLFVGVFTRRDKIAQKEEWTTSPWIIDEKAYAVGKGKKLILFKEKGVGSIGGIQGDYEFVEFSRDLLHDVAVALLQMFDLSTRGLRS